MIDAWIYSSCSSCRSTEAMLRDSGIAFNRRDFFKERFSRDELASLLSQAGLTAGDVLSRRSKVYLARRDEFDQLDDGDLLALMIEEPTLLRRPIVIGDGGVVIGHNPGQLEALISANHDNPVLSKE